MERALADWETLSPDDLATLQAHQVGPGADPPWGTLAMSWHWWAVLMKDGLLPRIVAGAPPTTE